MLITKARLRQIIKEELESLKEKEAMAGEFQQRTDEPAPETTLDPEMELTRGRGPLEALPFDYAAKSVNPVVIQQEANDAFLAGIIDRAMLDRMSNVIQGFRQIKKPSQRDFDKFAAARVELKKAIDASPDRLAKYEKLQARRSKRRPTPKDVQRAIAKSPIGKPTSMTAAGDGLPKP